jgi:hypothetical protein
MARTLRVEHPDPDTHRTPLYDLMGKSFGNYWGSFDYCRNGYIEESHYNWMTSRIGLLDGEIVSHFGVWDFRMRVGMDTVRTGGIGAVMTDRRFRKQGFMKETADAGCDALVREGYGFSILFGIPDFYQRFGYVAAWNSSAVTVAERDLPTQQPKLKLRKVDYGPDKGFDDIANRSNAGLTGTAVRPTYRRNRRPDDWACYRWQTMGGALAGYVIVAFDDRTCSLIDSGGDPEEVLSACAQLTKRRGCYELKIRNLHRRHPLYDALWSVPFQREEHHNPSGGGMIRVANLQAALKSIEKTLTRRLRESSYHNWNGNLMIQKERDVVMLEVSRRGVEVQSADDAKTRGTKNREHRLRGGDELALLLVGTDDPHRLIERHRMRTTGTAKGLLAALFPEQSPGLGLWDHI